jgi:hypothetical protein
MQQFQAEKGPFNRSTKKKAWLAAEAQKKNKPGLICSGLASCIP